MNEAVATTTEESVGEGCTETVVRIPTMKPAIRLCAAQNNAFATLPVMATYADVHAGGRVSSGMLRTSSSVACAAVPAFFIWATVSDLETMPTVTASGRSTLVTRLVRTLASQ